MTDTALRHLLEPRSIAVIGASDDVGKFGGRVIHHLIRHRFAGTLYPINPRREQIRGIPAFRSIGDVPEAPDAAIIAVPPTVLAETVRACAEAGVRVAVVITGNLSLGGRDGAELEAEIVAIAHAAGMRLLGPNCLGVINPHASLAFSPSVTMAVDSLLAGRVGIVSQSGALMTAMFIRGHDAGIGFSACVSVGNQADLELCDGFEYLVADPNTGAICLYIEGIKDLPRFRACAESARAAGKPVVAVKAGRTAAGAEMASSHTGSLAGSYEAFAALCEGLGIVVTDSAEAAVLCADALARHGAPRAPGLAVLSSSGGAAVLVSDAVAGRPGLEAAVLEDHTVDAIRAMTPHPLRTAMIDFGGYLRPFLVHEIVETLELLAADPSVGAMVYVMTPQPEMPALGQAFAEIEARKGIPVAFVSTAGSIADDVHRALREQGFAVHYTLDDALRVLTALMDHRRLSTVSGAAEAVDMAAVDEACELFAPGLLTEVEGKALLGAAGVTVTREELAVDADSAIAAAEAIGYPVVVKGVARGLIHKSDAGAVRLGLPDAASVSRAFEDIRSAVATAEPDARFQGCLVQETGAGVVEAFVGARVDPEHGPVVLVGLGGVWVEVMEDVRILPAPVDAATVKAALQGLHGWPLFAGARGRPVADADALAELVSRVSRLVASLDGRLVELDVNPVMVGAAGDGAMALDARGVWREAAEKAGGESA